LPAENRKMCVRWIYKGCVLAWLSLGHLLWAGEEFNRDRLLGAVERGAKVLARASRNYPTHRKCFACHHQTLPLLGLNAARAAGVSIDGDLAREILDFSTSSFRGKLEELKAGEGIGGRGLTVGYGLWTLTMADARPDELSEAMVT